MLAQHLTVHWLRTRSGSAALAGALALGFAACGSEAAWEAHGPPCGTSVVRGEVAFTGVDAVDVLLVVSDAPSMAQEQAVLARELPGLARAMTTGRVSEEQRYRPLRNVRIGIVSADLGVDAEPQVPGCTAFGRDASLQAGGELGDACFHPPAFLRYSVPTPEAHPLIAPPDRAAEDSFAASLACSGVLGSSGCGVVQPLEAALRALWPSGLSLEHTQHVAPVFASEPQGQRNNARFARNDPTTGLSFLQVVVISDGDDCSLQQPAALAASVNAGTLAPATACAQRGELLHTLERYTRGLRALRPNHEEVVAFAAITGVPQELEVSMPAFDPALRDARFAALLADPRMQPSAGPDGALLPVCESAQVSATPAPRLAEAARGFGANGAVVSICNPDWPRVLVPLFESGISFRLGSICLPRKPVRDALGLTQCQVLWELPAPERAAEGAPVACADRPFLREHAPRPRTEDGRPVCEVQQLAVTGVPAAPQLEPGAGWFFDDFTPSGPVCWCEGGTCNAIFFAPNKPPSSVVVRVECFQTTCWSRDGGPCEPAECSVP